MISLEALLDTGFDGDVVLPESAAADLAAPDSFLTWSLADDSQVVVPAYLGIIELVELTATLPVLISVLGDEGIVGRGVSDRYRVTLDHGRQLVLEP
jgi:predicted aspartyl protease